MENEVVYSGEELSGELMDSVEEKLDLFLEAEFESFRANAELDDLEGYRNDHALKCFGDGFDLYMVNAAIVGTSELEFEIYDDDRDTIIVFSVNRDTGKLEKVYAGTNNTNYILEVLDQLIEPSWIN